MTRVSVIIPTYNRSGYIKGALESVLTQDYGNIEVIVVDDGSIDNTRQVLQIFGNRIKYIYQDNAGPACARNRALKAATGDLIAFNDSDDIWCQDCLKERVAFLNKFKECAFVFTDANMSFNGVISSKSFMRQREYFWRIRKERVKEDWFFIGNPEFRVF